MNKRVSLLLLPLAASGVLAQDAPEEEIEVRRYTVEMIIFSYAKGISTGSEIFVPDEPPDSEFMLDDALDENFLNTVEKLPPEPVVRNEERRYELVMLAEEDFSLVDILDRLERLDAYEPLMHFGWTQPMYPDEEKVVRPLGSYMTPPEGLEGDLTLYLSRYLHLAINLQLDAAPPEQPVDLFAVRYPVRYRISEDRIFRNGELRYFDHPKFGVMAKISRVEEEEPAEDELLENSNITELLGYEGE